MVAANASVLLGYDGSPLGMGDLSNLLEESDNVCMRGAKYKKIIGIGNRG